MLNKQDKNYFLQRLSDFLRIRSVSADPKSKDEILRAATFLVAELEEIGFAPKKIEKLYTRGLSERNANPVLFAERLDAPRGRTVLVYGHYDVQPPDPLELWKTPPFEPSVRKGSIYARGATDDKGQLYTHIAALRLLSKEWGPRWPVNVKIVIEGEEENGGENLKTLILENPDKFKADVCLVSDTGFVDRKTPAIEVGLRGIIYFELEVVTSDMDLHSGLYGGAVHNPLNVVSQVLSSISKKFGAKKLRKVPINAEYPSFDIHGIRGGYQGVGSKTVIPGLAVAKFSIRTIPGQDTKKIIRAVSRLVKGSAPKGIRSSLKILGAGDSFLMNGNGRYLKLAQRSLKKIFGHRPVLTKSGGSIPIVSTIAKQLGAEVVLMGYGLPDDNLHSPNEKFDLKQFYRGIECNMDFMRKLSED